MLATKLVSSQHEMFIFNAKKGQFEEDAYLFYHRLTQKHQTEKFPLLWRGMSAFIFWQSRFLKQSSAVQIQLVEAREAFAGAERLMPEDPILLREYGFFLWQYESQMDKGLKMIQKAEKLRPTDPYVHKTLGNVYSNHSGNAYNLLKAEKEYREAIRLNPDLHGAYWGLSMLFFDMGKYREAQEQMKIYLRLDPQAEQRGKDYRDIINNVMSRKV